MGDCAFGGWSVGASALLGEMWILPLPRVGCNKKKTPRSHPGGVGGWGCELRWRGARYALRQDFMNALRSSPFRALVLASALQVLILPCWVAGTAAVAAGLALKQSFMNALRSSPFKALVLASVLQAPILLFWLVLAGADAAGAAPTCEAACTTGEKPATRAAQTAIRESCFFMGTPKNGGAVNEDTREFHWKIRTTTRDGRDWTTPGTVQAGKTPHRKISQCF